MDETLIRSVGFDRTCMTAEEIENPADILHKIYQRVGFAYRKTGRHISRTVNALDLAIISKSVRVRSPSLDGFLRSIEKAIL